MLFPICKCRKLYSVVHFKNLHAFTTLTRCGSFVNVRSSSTSKSTYESVEYTGNTLPGQKKDTLRPLPKAYSPVYTEAAWYDWWVKEGFFTPEYQRKSGKSSEKFVICLPPPNVTGTLHLGHALTNSIQDALVRWNRMRGLETLWIPGCDHAGIATQVVVERKLTAEAGQSRHDLGREKFVEEVWKWKNEKGDTIYDQMKRLGSSLDWNRACFTMDERMCEAVTEAFIRLYEEGLIYRSNRMVNWSCQLQSVISDIEVDNVQIFRPTKFKVPGYEELVELGKITSFAYPVVDSDEVIVVATTRPETMLGDTAVAVNPADQRYMHLHGKTLRHPLEERRIPIVCDEAVDVEFGTGAVKITPAHDKNDFDLGQRHDLPSVTVINKKGRMENVNEKLVGMKRFDARKAVIESLKDLGLFRETKPHEMVVPVCSRSKDIIEPMMMEQWYVDCDEMSASALEVVKLKDVEVIPEHAEKRWNNFMTNKLDWCISRQIWWGHRIPAYKVWADDQTEDEGVWVVGRNEDEAKKRAEEELGLTADQIHIKQDADVLDTWFSSALFPFSSLGWPKPTEDFLRYYPGTLLETGSDILFFWVARMVMLGLKLTDRLPFKTVVLHGILRDAQGRKMSKSLGNVIDPIDVITGISREELHQRVENSNLDEEEIERAIEAQNEDFPKGIPECGTDALRFTLCYYDHKEETINMDVLHVEAHRKFCNKIWQSFSYVSSCLDSSFKPGGHVESDDLVNQWIISRLCHMVKSCDQNFRSYDLQRACKALHNFWLNEFCGVYVEYSKPIISKGSKEEAECVKQVLHICMDTFLRALSPFMPYLTEELYQRLPHPKDSTYPSICVAPYPQENDFPSYNAELADVVSITKSICSELSAVTNKYQFKISLLPVYITCKDVAVLQMLQHTSVLNLIGILTKCKTISFVSNDADNLKQCLKRNVNSDVDVYIMLKGLIKPEIEIEKLLGRIKRIDTKLRQITKKPLKNLHPYTLEKIQDLENSKKELEREISVLRDML